MSLELAEGCWQVHLHGAAPILLSGICCFLDSSVVRVILFRTILLELGEQKKPSNGAACNHGGEPRGTPLPGGLTEVHEACQPPRILTSYQNAFDRPYTRLRTMWKATCLQKLVGSDNAGLDVKILWRNVAWQCMKDFDDPPSRSPSTNERES